MQRARFFPQLVDTHAKVECFVKEKVLDIHDSFGQADQSNHYIAKESRLIEELAVTRARVIWYPKRIRFEVVYSVE